MKWAIVVFIATVRLAIGGFIVDTVTYQTSVLSSASSTLRVDGASAILAAENDPFWSSNRPAVDSAVGVLERNVLLNSFRLQAESTAIYRDFVGGWVDGYVDQSGINTGSSEYAYYSDRSYRPFMPIMDPPVQHYKMNDNAADTVVEDAAGFMDGVSIDGNTESFSVDGKLNKALDTCRLSLGVSIYNSLDLTDVTVAVWINVDPDNGSQNGTFFSAEGSIYMRVNSGYYSAWVDGTPEIGTAAAISPGEWKHIILRKQGNELYLYENLVEIGYSDTAAGSFTFPYTRDSTIMWYFTGENVYYGAVDDFRFYEWALSESEMAMVYNEGVGTEDTAVGITTNMSLISNVLTPASQPEEVELSFVMTTNSGVILNTQLVGSVSCDGGTNYQDVVLEESVALDATKRLYVGSLTNISNPGRALVYRLQTFDNVNLSVYGASLMYK